MNIYFLADTHLGMKGDNHIWLNDCIEYYYKVFIPYCKEHVKPDDILVHLGDVYDNRSNIGIETIYRSIKLFEDLSKIFSKIIITVGNHDIFNKHSTEITTLNMLKYIPNVEIIYNPEVRNINGKDILFVPWVEDLSDQKKLLSSHNVDYVFGHLEIGGAVMSSKGNRSKTNNSIQSDDFKKAQVFAGHIHIRQSFKNINYVGCPYHKDRGDIGNSKGFTILDLETGQTQFIENKHSPQFKTYRIYDILDKTVGELKEEWKNNYIDLIIKSNDYPKCNFNKLREIFKDVYKEFEPISEKTDVITETDNIKITETKSAPDMLNEYLSQCNVSDVLKDGIMSKIEKYKDNL